MANPPFTAHIHDRFDRELNTIDKHILDMGNYVSKMLSEAVKALESRQIDKIDWILGADKHVDSLESNTTIEALHILSLRQPVSVDLRRILAGMTISKDLERIGDYTKNIAKRIKLVLDYATGLTEVTALGKQVFSQFERTLEAHKHLDAQRALEIREADQFVDKNYNHVFLKITDALKTDPENIGAGVHLLFIVKNLERIGDIITHINEMIYFHAQGTMPPLNRTKGEGEIYHTQTGN